MPVAAVPAYLGQKFEDASPGMRFGMYLRVWGENNELQKIDWRLADRIWPKHKKNPKWEDSDNKQGAIEAACPLSHRDRQTIESLIKRQEKIASMQPGMAAFSAKSTAPFTTGLGNEHPLENGFAFLWPYGLPYLPGSGVKGVLRQAARELASGDWGDTKGWSAAKQIYEIPPRDEGLSTVGNHKKPIRIELSLIDLLFGLESKDGAREHFRSVLSFWDVIPEIQGDRLLVEIMTPHQKHYYQDGEPPHDCGQPNPIAFLTVPPGSRFTFHVRCDLPRLADIDRKLAENDRWKTLLQAAFEHAFDWLGFGAKAAVGYGAMRRTDTSTASCSHSATGPAGETDTPLQAQETVWENAVLVFDPGRGELTAQHGGRKTAPLKGEAAEALRASLSEDQRRRLKKKKSLKGVKVRVRVLGNQIELAGLVS